MAVPLCVLFRFTRRGRLAHCAPLRGERHRQPVECCHATRPRHGQEISRDPSSQGAGT